MNHPLRELNAEEISAVAGGDLGTHLDPPSPWIVALPPLWRFDPEPAPWRVIT
jgi:hypothetical protein